MPNGKMTWRIYRQLTSEGMQFDASDMLKLLELLKAEPRLPALPEAVEKLVRRCRYINLGYCYLSEFLRGSNGVCDLRKVV